MNQNNNYERRIFLACQGTELNGYSIQCEFDGVTYKFKAHDFIGLCECVADQMMKMAPPQDEPIAVEPETKLVIDQVFDEPATKIL